MLLTTTASAIAHSRNMDALEANRKQCGKITTGSFYKNSRTGAVVKILATEVTVYDTAMKATKNNVAIEDMITGRVQIMPTMQLIVILKNSNLPRYIKLEAKDLPTCP